MQRLSNLSPASRRGAARGRAVTGTVVAVSVTTLTAAFGCAAVTTVELLPELGQAGQGSWGGSGPGAIATASGSTQAAGAAGARGGATSGQSSGTSSVSGWPAELIHLYDFSGTGTEIVDRRGGGSGTIGRLDGGLPASLDGSGRLSIADGYSYVKLPSWLIKNAKSSSITIAVWFTWDGSNSWARVFDFGATNEGDNTPGSALSQFYFTTRSEPNGYYSTVLDNDCNDGWQAGVEPPTAFPVSQAVFVAVVVEGDDTTGSSTLHLYLNGAEVGPASTTIQRLTEFTDQNCWLGLSQWAHDNTPAQHFNGSYDEFRMYSRALTAAEVARLVLDDPSVL